MKSTLILYTKKECSLCNQAMEVIASTIDPQHWQIESVDIESDPLLMKKYAWLIPVVARADNAAELQWPFTAGRIKKLVA